MKFRGSAAIIAVAMSLGSGAIAQTGAQEAKSQEDNPLVLPTVNIKGEKIKRSQQDTYTSTGVITGQQIEDLGIKDMRDALKLQGNVYVAPSNNGNNGISIRGINSEGIGEPGANVRSLTTLTIDGAAQSFEGMRRGARGSWDVEQIEVLRGPQSTLQGRNSLAGAVVIKTHDPTDYWEGAARITAGERDLFSPAFMLSGPISDDFSFRISGETARGNKGITYSIPEAASLDDDEYRNTRVKLRFRPTAAPQLEMKLTVANTMDDPAVTAVSSPYFNRQLNFKPNDNYYIDFRRNDVRNRVLELSYGLSPGITVSSITTQVQTDARIGSPPLPNYFRR
ncbi:MAG: TonB-dependent receptor plug domain-containing protein, partial [Burkholderiales bacterium]|nr:TonB-dependent receptor plug domain-containing protein [Burkholderiales bacterium]